MGGGERLQGMPLGNYTSQWFANIYLDKLDTFVKHFLKVKYYIRYVDDFVIFSNSILELQRWNGRIDEFLKNNLVLELHPHKSKVVLLKRGVTFLGFKNFYRYRIIKESNRKNFERKLKELRILYKENKIDREKVVEHLEGWLAFAKHANSYKYCRELLKNFNKNFPIIDKHQVIRTKKIKNFFRKVYASKMEFSSQKTLFLFRKGLTFQEIAAMRSINEGTVWQHFADLIEHGQLSVWNILSKRKIIIILSKIKSFSEPLKQTKERINGDNISYDEINCVRSYLMMKEKIRDTMKKIK